MRTLISVTLILSVFIYSCKKSPAAPTPPIVAGSVITITSISPAVPYLDDEITITGTGFNPDKTKDTVDFGTGDATMYPFSTLGSGGANPAITANETVIISATTTKLVVKPAYPFISAAYSTDLDSYLFNVTGGRNRDNRIRVRSNGLQGISAPAPFKQLPGIGIALSSFITGPSNNIYNEVRPNDSVLAFVTGMTSNNICNLKVSFSCSKVSSCTFVDGYLTLNGYSPQCECDNYTTVYGCGGISNIGRIVSYDEIHHSGLIILFIPYNFFGTDVRPGLDPGIRIKMKIENMDGKSTIKKVLCMAYPSHK